MVLFPSTWSRVRLRVLYLIKSDISRKVNGLFPLHLLQGEIEYLIKSDISRKGNGLVPLHLLQGEIEGSVPD